MKLTEEQKERFDRDGYLFFPSLFKPGEIKVLTDGVPSLYAQRRPENVREKTGDVVRTNFAAHMDSYPFPSSRATRARDLLTEWTSLPRRRDGRQAVGAVRRAMAL